MPAWPHCFPGPTGPTTPAPYVQNYGETAALEAHEGQKWVYVRENWLEPLVLRFLRAADLRADARG